VRAKETSSSLALLAKKISRIAALTLRYAAKPKERGKRYDTTKTTTPTAKQLSPQNYFFNYSILFLNFNFFAFLNHAHRESLKLNASANRFGNNQTFDFVGREFEIEFGPESLAQKLFERT
jgi:hypothetical protein